MLEHTPGDRPNRRESQEQSPRVHQTPFYVIPTIENSKLLTLPEGKLMHGLRNAVTSHERNAIQIARLHDLAVKGRGSLILPAREKHVGYGFVVEPAWKTTIPAYTDYTENGHIPNHSNPLELHDYRELLDQFADTPSRQVEFSLIKAFGNFVLTRHL